MHNSILRFKGRILCGVSVGGQISNSEADDSVPRAVASEVPSICPLRKLRSLPLAALNRRSSAQVEIFWLFGNCRESPQHLVVNSISRRNHGFNGSKTDFHGLIRPDPS